MWTCRLLLLRKDRFSLQVCRILTTWVTLTIGPMPDLLRKFRCIAVLGRGLVFLVVNSAFFLRARCDGLGRANMFMCLIGRLLVETALLVVMLTLCALGGTVTGVLFLLSRWRLLVPTSLFLVEVRNVFVWARWPFLGAVITKNFLFLSVRL